MKKMKLPNDFPIKGKSLTIIPIDGIERSFATSDNVTISCDPAQEGGDFSYDPADLKLEWTVKGTHKTVRQMRKFRKETGLHKPRLPRKLKKKVKRFINECRQFAMTLPR